jgi:NAD(P)-dependent dehydrogenase (short-subunit alcohol dehydrogenase family)
VALVAGATRGAGRGIARALAEAGAFVYATGRSVRGRPSAYNRPETITDTAKLIAAAGGQGVAVRVDHTDARQVARLVSRITRTHGRLDVLVNCVAGEDPSMAQWGSLWQVDIANADLVLRQALVSHLITIKAVVPLMIERRRGLIVEVTENDVLGSGAHPIGGVVKSAAKILALTMASELYPHGVSMVAVTPGFLRSEAMLDHFGVTEDNWREGAKTDVNFLESESPLYVGRAVAALAADRDVLKRTGQLWSSWELMHDYGFTDADGRQPDWGSLKLDFSMFPPTFLEQFRTGFLLQREWLGRLTGRVDRWLLQLPSAPAATRPRRATRSGRT